MVGYAPHGSLDEPNITQPFVVSWEHKRVYDAIKKGYFRVHRRVAGRDKVTTPSSSLTLAFLAKASLEMDRQSQKGWTTP